MHELQAIVNAYQQARQRGERAALATVVSVIGSAYAGLVQKCWSPKRAAPAVPLVAVVWNTTLLSAPCMSFHPESQPSLNTTRAAMKTSYGDWGWVVTAW
jgi:hypothetical protein